MNTFQSLNLPVPLQEALVRMQYAEPTEIQARAIPIAMQGHDILGSAQTGTGKTAAFGIPLVNKLIEDPEAAALILTPTRELAEQVIDVLHQLLNKRRDIKTALLIGGMPIQKQFLRLKERPRVIVGTPGRINDHLDRRSLSLKQVKILVLDEADRMLDMGFGVQLEEIAKYLPEQRQTFMFSATMPKRIISLADKFLTLPQRIKVGVTHAPLARIKQDIVRTSEDKKYAALLQELSKREGSIIIFAKTKRKVDLLAKKLNQEVGTAAMHGDLRQHQRTRVLKEFREQKYRILVATDVAARGLDIPHIEHVINYDLPQAPEDYIHRIGRTARGLAQGSALCFISREDEKYWRAIERLLGGDESAPSMQRAPARNTRNNGSAQRQSYGRGGSDQPRSNSRFGNVDSRGEAKPRSRSRFGDKDAQQTDARPGSRSRFADRDTPRSDARPGSRSRFGDKDAPRSDARPGSRSRFADKDTPRSDARPGSRSRFADKDAPRSDARTGSRSRFADRDAQQTDARTGSRSRFADRDAQQTDARPGSRSRFADRDAPRSDARTGSRSRFADKDAPRSDARPGSRSRFADRDAQQTDARTGSRSRFADRDAQQTDARPGSRSRFADKDAPRSDARPSSRSRFADKDAPAAAKPRSNDKIYKSTESGGRTRSAAPKKPRTDTKKSYGPQNRPPKKKKPEEELL